MTCQRVVTGLTFSTSSIQRDVIQAQGQSGSNQKSATTPCSLTPRPTRPSPRVFPVTAIFPDPCERRARGDPTGPVARRARPHRHPSYPGTVVGVEVFVDPSCP